MKTKWEVNERLMQFLGCAGMFTAVLGPFFTGLDIAPNHPPLWTFSGLMFFGAFCIVVLTVAAISDFKEDHGSFYIVRRVREPLTTDLRAYHSTYMITNDGD